MAVLAEPNRLNDWLKWEQENRYSREKVTIASGQNLSLGQVVGKITASGKYAAFNQDGTDGTEAAAGIVISDYDASTADLEGVIICRDAIVVEDNLVFPSDIEAAEQAAAMAELKVLGIIARAEV